MNEKLHVLKMPMVTTSYRRTETIPVTPKRKYAHAYVRDHRVRSILRKLNHVLPSETDLDIGRYLDLQRGWHDQS